MRGVVPAITFPVLRESPGVVCAVSTRIGGVSRPPFDTLNLSFSPGDDPDCVRENRQRFLASLEIPPEGVVVGQQVHGAHVQVVGWSDRGRGVLGPDSVIPASDGLATADRGVYLFTVSADCPLIGILAPPARGIALAHAGWWGVGGGIPGAAVEALQGLSGSDPEEMVAVIGPAIGPCCYVVGDEVMDALAPAARRGAEILDGTQGTVRGEGRKHRLDLHRAIRLLLEEKGLRPERIEASLLCSSCNPERFFSHRRDGARTGRIAMVMGMRE